MIIEGFCHEWNDITSVIPVLRVHIREAGGANPFAPISLGLDLVTSVVAPSAEVEGCGRDGSASSGTANFPGQVLDSRPLLALPKSIVDPEERRLPPLLFPHLIPAIEILPARSYPTLGGDRLCPG